MDSVPLTCEGDAHGMISLRILGLQRWCVWNKVDLVPLTCEDNAYGMKRSKHHLLAKVMRME